MNKAKSGFTIVELLIVIVVIAILAAISVVAYGNVRLRANDTRRLSDFQIIHKAVQLYYADHGRYPSCGTTEVVPSGCQWGDLATKLVPTYLQTVPIDPKHSPPNNAYYYAVGYKKAGTMSHTRTDSDQHYSIGTHLEAKGCPCSSAWGSPYINHMEGN